MLPHILPCPVVFLLPLVVETVGTANSRKYLYLSDNNCFWSSVSVSRFRKIICNSCSFLSVWPAFVICFQGCCILEIKPTRPEWYSILAQVTTSVIVCIRKSRYFAVKHERTTKPCGKRKCY